MTIEETRATLDKYFNSEHMDTGTLADDVVFKIMATGEEQRGPEAVLNMLHGLYQGAFEADAVLKNIVIGEGKAITEWDFAGNHVGQDTLHTVMSASELDHPFSKRSSPEVAVEAATQLSCSS